MKGRETMENNVSRETYVWIGDAKAAAIYLKIWDLVGHGEAWIDEDTETVAKYIGEDIGSLSKALRVLTGCGLLRHDPGYGYLIGGACHAV